MATHKTTTSAKPQPSEKQKQCFYLVDERQSAELEYFRMAMRGIAELSFNESLGEDSEISASRINIHALFDQLEKRLGSILAAETGLRSVWIDPAVTVVRQSPAL